MRDDEITCHTCRHSIGDLRGDTYILMCELQKKEAKKTCDRYEREPGSDDEVNHED